MNMRKALIPLLLIQILLPACGEQKKDKAALLERLNLQERYSEAVERATEFMRSDPDDVRLFYYRGWSQLLLGKQAMAASDFEQCLRMDPEYYGGYKGMAEIFLQRKLYDMAALNYDRALKLAPGNDLKAALTGNMGYLLYLQKKPREAEEALLRAITLKDDAALHWRLGHIYYLQKKRDKALGAWKEALKRPFRERKFRHIILFDLAYYYYKDKKDMKKALPYMEEALMLSPNDRLYLSLYGKIRGRGKRK